MGGQILFYFFVGIIFYLMYEIFLHSNFTRFLMLAGQNSFLSVGGKKGARKWLVLSIKKKTHTHLLGQSWRLLITYWKCRFFTGKETIILLVYCFSTTNFFWYFSRKPSLFKIAQIFGGKNEFFPSRFKRFLPQMVICYDAKEFFPSLLTFESNAER